MSKKTIKKKKTRPLKILFASSEVWPISKTGGLADVAFSLPYELQKIGVDIRILTPAWPNLSQDVDVKGKNIHLGPFDYAGPVSITPITIKKTLPAYIINCARFFQREGNPYTDEYGTDYSDNPQKFALLSHVAALITSLGKFITRWQPDILHINDWQTGLAPAYLHQWKQPIKPTVLTIHNLQYQGNFPFSIQENIGLSSNLYTPQGIEFYGMVSFLKAAITYSQHITTVSPTYAQEIKTPEYGYGFDGILRANAHKITGILNGVNYDLWSPETSPHIPHNYTLKNLNTQKKKNKAELQKIMGLEVNPDRPLACFVTRMNMQKGTDILLAALPRIVAANMQVAILGSGEPRFENDFRKSAEQWPEHITAVIGYNEELSYKLFAGSDIALMPSLFEPCGLTQLYALRFGTIPIVRYTGGLADTIIDAHDIENGTGFFFGYPSPDDLMHAIYRALHQFQNPKQWKKIQKNAMQKRFQWNQSAQDYINIYRQLKTMYTL